MRGLSLVVIATLSGQNKKKKAVKEAEKGKEDRSILFSSTNCCKSRVFSPPNQKKPTCSERKGFFFFSWQRSFMKERKNRLVNNFSPTDTLAA